MNKRTTLYEKRQQNLQELQERIFKDANALMREGTTPTGVYLDMILYRLIQHEIITNQFVGVPSKISMGLPLGAVAYLVGLPVYLSGNLSESGFMLVGARKE